MGLTEGVANPTKSDHGAGVATQPLSRRLSGVAGSLLCELHAGGRSEFGVDVGEVGLHGAR